MAFSSSRGILYTAPPAETDRRDAPKASDGGTDGNVDDTASGATPAPADD